MTIINEFDYHKPKTIEQALEILYDYKNSKVLSGGTDLVGNLKNEMMKPSNLVDIKGLKGLDKIKVSKRRLQIGALVTFSDLIGNKLINESFPVISEMCQTVASKAIRNRATMVGNICSAVPCMDSGAILSVYNAQVNASDYYEEREIPISKWFKGPRKTTIRKKEMVLGLNLDAPKQHAGAYIKLGRYKGEDLAQATCAVLALPNDEYRIAFGSVGPTPIRAKKIEKLINGMSLTESLLNDAFKLVDEEISPITDIRASKEYRMHMCKVMLGRALKIARDRFNGTGSAYGEKHI